MSQIKNYYHMELFKKYEHNGIILLIVNSPVVSIVMDENVRIIMYGATWPAGHP